MHRIICLHLVILLIAGCPSLADDAVQPPEQSAATKLTSEELLKFALPSTVHHRTPIPDEENAYLVWMEAVRTFERIKTDKDQQVIVLTREIAENQKAFPDGDEGKLLREWLIRQKLALDLVDRAAEMGTLQLPPLPLDADSEEWDFGSPWRHVAYLKSLRAKRSAKLGDWDRAVSDIRSLLRIGNMLAAGSADVIRFLVAELAIIERIGLGTVQGLARAPSIPDAVVLDTLDLVREPNDLCEVWAQVARIEFTEQFVPRLERLATQNGLDSLLEEWDRMILLSEVAGSRNTIRSLLKDHPEPIDYPETVRLASQQVQRRIEACEMPWGRAKDWIAAHLPEQTDAEKVLEASIRVRNAMFRAEYLQSDLKEELAFFGDGVPTEQEVQQAREHLPSTFNPLGRQSVRQYLREFATPNAYLALVFRVRAYWRATRLVILLQLHKRHHGELPASLSNLDVAGNEDSTFIDPFSDKEFRYDAERSILWSVGENGVDDGGCEDGDIVWKVTTLSN